jgi:hypothetical protein
MISTLLRWSAFSLMAAFGLLGSLFVAGEISVDPGGWEAVALVALWVLPMLFLCALAVRRTDTAHRVLVAAVTVLVALWVWFALAPGWWRSLMDERGPVLAIASFAVGVAVAFLGLRRPGTAGGLLVVMATVPVVASAVASAVLDADRPDPAGVLGGSSTAAAIPTLVVGVLFLLSYAAERVHARSDGRRSDVSDLGPARTGR